MTTKICSTCKIEKSIEEFHKDKRLKKERKSWCKICALAKAKQYYQTSRGKIVHKEYESLRRLSDPRITLFDGAKQRAKRKNLEFTITKNDIVIPEYCPVFNVKLKNGKTLSNDSPTLDRINNNKGYTPDNICVISWRANRLKSDSSIEEIESLLNFLYKINDLPNRIYETRKKEQKIVKKRVKPIKTLYVYNGCSKKLIEWARIYKINYRSLSSRINRSGWSIEEAIETPFKGK